MTVEIERKFLVKNDGYKEKSHSSYEIKQGFLNSHKERTVRVRLSLGKGSLTVKGVSTDSGLSRFEWEMDINPNHAIKLLGLCEKGIIEKVRYEVHVGEHMFEIDEFKGANQGLIIAEVELKSVDENFLKPDWLGEEVTGDIRYYNSQLSKKPFSNWAEKSPEH